MDTYGTSQFELVTLQVSVSHMWLAVPVLYNISLESWVRFEVCFVLDLVV